MGEITSKRSNFDWSWLQNNMFRFIAPVSNISIVYLYGPEKIFAEFSSVICELVLNRKIFSWLFVMYFMLPYFQRFSK